VSSDSESDNDEEGEISGKLIGNDEKEEILIENGEKVKKITKILKYEIDKGDRKIIRLPIQVYTDVITGQKYFFRTIKRRKICYLTSHDSNCSFQQKLSGTTRGYYLYS